jgi:hypothetical protein
LIWLDLAVETRARRLLGMEQWAEIRRMKHVERLSQREIRRRTGIHRDTIRMALASPEPPSYSPRPPRASKLDPFVWTIEELLEDEPTLSGVRIREELEKLGYEGGKTILDDLLRELRPRFCRRFGRSSASSTRPKANAADYSTPTKPHFSTSTSSRDAPPRSQPAVPSSPPSTPNSPTAAPTSRARTDCVADSPPSPNACSRPSTNSTSTAANDS